MTRSRPAPVTTTPSDVTDPLVTGSNPARIFSSVDFPRPRDLAHPKVAQLFNEIESLLAPDVARSEQAMASA